LIMSGGTTKADAAWRWLSFLSRQSPAGSQPGMMPISPAVGVGGPGIPIDGGFSGNPFVFLPARISLAEQAGRLGKGSAAIDAVIRAGVTSSAAAISTAEQGNLFSGLYTGFSMVVNDDKVTPERAATDAQLQYEQMVANVPTPQPAPGPVTVAAPESYEAPPGATVITFITSDTSGDRRRARLFRERNPELYVQIKPSWVITDSYDLTKLANSADCFYADSLPNAEGFAGLLDLQPLADSDRLLSFSDYPPALLNAFRNNGGLFGLPTRLYLRGMGYNPALFNAAGLQPPAATWTPEEFLAAAKALTNGDTFGLISASPESDLFFFMEQFGARLSSGTGPDLKASFTTPETLAAIGYYLDLARTHKVMPPPVFNYRPTNTPPSVDPMELIGKGKVAMWLDAYMASPIGPDGNATQPAVAPLPVGKAGLSQQLVGAGGALYISRSTKQAANCWRWLAFLSEQPDYFSGYVPARISQANSPEFAAAAAPETVALYKAYAPVLTRADATAPQPVFSEGFDTYWLFRALDEHLKTGAALDRLLADAEQKTNDFIACAAKAPEPGACAKQVDPTYDGWMTGGGAG
jgi:ABC-type glycerol-3-phosphate transport system substrate-binding protein